MPILNWLTREKDLANLADVPTRLLQEVQKYSYGSTDNNNMLIHGDNLEALKALLPYYAGRVRCVYIDPPYNTGSAFKHYDDNLEHSIWLSVLLPRLYLIKELLAEDGSLWVNIDDDESHYLKVLIDEIFGRKSFVVNCVWQKRTSPDGRIHMGDAHDHILVYANKLSRQTFNNLPLDADQKSKYKNPDSDPLGPWVSTDFTAQGYRPNQMYKIKTPGGRIYEPPEGRCWANIESNFKRLRNEGRIWFGKSGTARPRLKNYLSDAEGVKSWSWWTNKEVGHNQEAKKETITLFGAQNAFDTPKPERLIERILTIATNPGDIVLDSFLGSGTTAAVAHKMNRQYIGIELGDHAKTHCQPRLKKVVDGEQGGISKAIKWKGGGGFRFYELGPEVYNQDGGLTTEISYETMAAHIWFFETRTPLLQEFKGPILGFFKGDAYILLYQSDNSGKDKIQGTVLTRPLMKTLVRGVNNLSNDFCGEIIVYGETTKVSEASLRSNKVLFKQIPYDIKLGR